VASKLHAGRARVVLLVLPLSHLPHIPCRIIAHSVNQFEMRDICGLHNNTHGNVPRLSRFCIPADQWAEPVGR
jgi:hypothetical protein